MAEVGGFLLPDGRPSVLLLQNLAIGLGYLKQQIIAAALQFGRGLLCRLPPLAVLRPQRAVEQYLAGLHAPAVAHGIAGKRGRLALIQRIGADLGQQRRPCLRLLFDFRLIAVLCGGIFRRMPLCRLESLNQVEGVCRCGTANQQAQGETETG